LALTAIPIFGNIRVGILSLKAHRFRERVKETCENEFEFQETVFSHQIPTKDINGQNLLAIAIRKNEEDLVSYLLDFKEFTRCATFF